MIAMLRRQKRAVLLDAIGVFCIILAVRWALLAAFAIDIPWWDQWNGEGADVVLPALDGSFSWSDLFKPHNEHRIVFTRLACLLLLHLGGSWSPLLEASFASMLPAITGALACAMLATLYGTRGLNLTTGILILCFSLPLSTENYLSGFQSQIHFLVLFSLAALFLGCDERCRPGRIFAALALAALAALSMGSGALTFVALAGLWTFRAVADGPLRLRWLAAAALAAILAFLTVKLLVVHVPGHEVLRARGVGDVLTAFGRALAWPNRLGVLLFWGPALITALVLCFEHRLRGRETVFPFAIMLWVAIISGSAALLRGVGGAAPADRYHDYLSLLFVAAGCLPAVLAPGHAPASVRSAAVYRGCLLAALLHAGLPGFAGLAGESERLRLCAAKLNEAWQAGGAEGRDVLRRSTPAVDLPYPDPDLIWSFLAHENAAFFMPAAIRPDLLRMVQVKTPAGAAAFATVPPPPAGIAFGTYQGADSWTGDIDLGLIPVMPGYLRLSFAGYPAPDRVEVSIEEWPSRHRVVVASPTPPGSGDVWRTATFPTRLDTSTVHVRLHDAAQGPFGWVAIGGLENLSLLDRWRTPLGGIAAAILLLGTIPLLSSLTAWPGDSPS